MLDVIQASIAAHGGLSRWSRVRQISATFAPSGIALILRGQEAFTRQPTRVTVDTREARALFDPFLAPGQIGLYEPHRMAVQKLDGGVIELLENPRQSFERDAPWSAAQLAYFAGYSLWTYFNLPFCLSRDDIQCAEADAWREDGETWRVVRVRFPASFVTHAAEQVLYIDKQGLIRRHDYSVDIAFGVTVVHYLLEQRVFDGIVFPTRRRIYTRGVDGQPDEDNLILQAHLDDYQLS